MLGMATEIIKNQVNQCPEVFKGDPHAYKIILELKNIDGVIIATPWEWQNPMIMDSL